MKLKTIAAALAALIVLICAGCGSSPAASGTAAPSGSPASSGDALDMAIRDANDYLNDSIPERSKIVILNIQSSSAALSDYIIDELIANAVNDRNFEVVDRQQLDLIRSEQNFQWAGEVDDNMALEVGKFFGAQTIVSGRVSQIGERYRFTIRALDVQTARVQAQNNWNLTAGETLTALVNDRSGASAGNTAAAAARPASGVQASQTPAAQAPVQSAGTRTQPAPITVERPPTPAAQTPLSPGTYTFYPRPRALKNGLEVNVYLDKIVIRSGYMNLFFVDRPNGKGSGGLGAGNLYHEKIIQDLDRPSRSFNATGGFREDRDTGAYVVTFENVTARRFKFTNTAYGEVGFYFEEIILGEPDID